MGIDGIGKGGDTPKVDPSSGATSVKGIEGERFELSTEGVEQAQGAGLLEQVQRGEVGLDAYLDVRVNDAVGHLEGRLSPEQLEFVKEELRAQLQSDPVLIELVRRATGQSPEAPST
ncbi:MAG: hypothetical protein RL685_5686 [Pseudomonadota bacterium]|jgi:hypothetical protein